MLSGPIKGDQGAGLLGHSPSKGKISSKPISSINEDVTNATRGLVTKSRSGSNSKSYSPSQSPSLAEAKAKSYKANFRSHHKTPRLSKVYVDEVPQSFVSPAHQKELQKYI